MIEVGLGVGMIIIAIAFAKRILGGGGDYGSGKKHRLQASAAVRVTSSDRQKALEVYESLAKEKLEVIKTALAMGYNERDLANLDARLEQLIGREQLSQLASGQVPLSTSDLRNTDLRDEQRKLKGMGATR